MSTCTASRTRRWLADEGAGPGSCCCTSVMARSVMSTCTSCTAKARPRCSSLARSCVLYEPAHGLASGAASAAEESLRCLAKGVLALDELKQVVGHGHRCPQTVGPFASTSRKQQYLAGLAFLHFLACLAPGMTKRC